MARYRLTEPAFVHGTLLAAGDEVVVDDSTIPGPHMAALDDAARKAVKAAGDRMTKVDPVEAMTS
ncbi:MAG: hypothetical protein M0006_09565 [Magnetospirillum sp.]|nr:hypothetical protein [Magnetospirillum sp.]